MEGEPRRGGAVNRRELGICSYFTGCKNQSTHMVMTWMISRNAKGELMERDRNENGMR
jgi:hypothetical protein